MLNEKQLLLFVIHCLTDGHLRSTFEVLEKEFHDISFASSVSHEERSRAGAILESHLGYRLTRRPSTIAKCGQGVFVEEGLCHFAIFTLSPDAP